MSREEAINELAQIFEEHRKHPLFGCSCMPIDEVNWAREILPITWERHMAELAIHASAGF